MIPTAPDPSERIRLHVLGRIGLWRDEEPVDGLLAQPKRFGVLVYLALRRPYGFVSRDELLGVFWPESTERRARASLRQALRFLRGHLGGETITNRGDAEVGIRTGAMACDAADLMRALEEGDDRRAVDGYGGELLPGFTLAGVHEFDRWLHAERQTLRAAAVKAALRLADDAESLDDLERAAHRVRWALEKEPTDEAVARRLISLQGRSGNRAAAAATYEALTRRLVDEFDLSPSPETRELIAAIREAGTPTPESPSSETRTLSPQRVLVVSLEDLTNEPTLVTVGRLAADVVAQGLAMIPELEVVPPLAAVQSSKPDPGGEAPTEVDETGLPADLLAIARRTGAGTLVTGTYHVEGDRIHLRARLTDVAHGRLLKSPDPVVRPSATPLDAIEELRDRVTTTLAPALARRVVHVREATRPPSIEAYSAYLDGLDRFIRGHWREALDRFRHSVELEPSYALPRIVRAISHWNLGELPEARTVALEAAELRGSLGRFERAVLDMVLAWLDGDWAEARTAAQAQAELAPGSIPHFQVAEEARRLNRPREAREVLSHLDPETGELKGWIYYWIELTEAHHHLGDHQRELELAHRCRRLHPDDPVSALLEIRALAALGRHDDVARLTAEALAVPGDREPVPGALLREAALELRAHGLPDAAEPLLDRAVGWYEDRAGGEGGVTPLDRERARTLYHAGRLRDAKRTFARLIPGSRGGVQPVGHHHGHLQAHLDEGYLAVIAAREGDAHETERWCAHLEELQVPFLYGAQWFWLAAVAALHNEPDRAVERLRRAFAEGLPHEHFIHTDPHLLPLKGHAAFDALVRPRG